MSRRQVLAGLGLGTTALGAAVAASATGTTPPPLSVSAAPAGPGGVAPRSAGSERAALRLVERAHAHDPGDARSLAEIDHFVFLMQENRSYDHYFGRVRAPGSFPFLHGANTEVDDLAVFDPAHDWVTQHECWNHGRMNGWLRAHRSSATAAGSATMGYYTRADLPVHYALADAFTLCDRYFCSVLGPTAPNRLMAMSGSIGAAGLSRHPVTGHLAQHQPGSLPWRTYPENLSAAGVPWKVYNALPASTSSELTSTLRYFAAYRDPSSELYARGLAPRWPADFVSDAAANRLPAVSWIIPAIDKSEHPNYPPPVGAETIMTVVRALMANPAVWQRSALIVSYDENGGYYDHVAPPVAPSTVPGEHVGGRPVGLGFRVPCMIISPMTRGGRVDSHVYDHTSQLRLLERRFNVPVPNVSPWRRATVGDLTEVFRTGADTRPVALPGPATVEADAAAARTRLHQESLPESAEGTG